MANAQDLTTFIALFHHRDRAASAIRDLEEKGFSSSAMTIINGSRRGDEQDARGNERDTRGDEQDARGDEREIRGGLGDQYGYGDQADLNTIGVPDRDRKRLQDGLDQGGTVLMLKGDGDRADEIDTIFHKYSDQIDDASTESAEYVAPVAAAAPIAPSAPAQDSSVIPIVEEELVVGKRSVDRGGVRVFSRVVEEPVTASVKLHEEHVVVDRRPVDRAVTDADLRQGDRIVELTETQEEAVVGKTARVVEEVLIGKQASERSETIQDSVRRTEVDVESVDASDATDKR